MKYSGRSQHLLFSFLETYDDPPPYIGLGLSVLAIVGKGGAVLLTYGLTLCKVQYR